MELSRTIVKLHKRSLGLFLAAIFLCVVPGSASAGTLHLPANNLGLTVYWSFDDATGTVATDFSGNRNAATIFNTSLPPTTTSGWTGVGKRGAALNFDGTNDYASAPPVNLSSTNAITVAFWLKKSTFANDDGLAFEATTNTNLAATGFIIDPNSGAPCNGQIQLNTLGDVGNSTACFTRPTTGDWHHYAAIFVKGGISSVTDLYIDGVLQNAASRPSTNNNNNNFGNDPWYIMSRAGSSLFGSGTLDDVRVYKRRLSATEVATLYKTTAAKINTSQNSRLANGLLGLWSFNGADMDWGSNKAFDRSRRGSDGTLVNMSMSTTPVLGITGQALFFNGTNNEIQIPVGAIIGASSVSVSAWIKVRSYSEATFTATAGSMQGAVIFNTRNADADISPTFAISPISGGAGTQNGITFACDSSALGVGAKGATDIPLNTWVHVVGTFAYSGTGTYGGTWNVYLNGAKDNAAANNFNLAGTCGGSFGGSPWRIGNASQWPTPDTEFTNATIDEVRVYNRELTAGEAKQLYLMGAAKVNHSQNSRLTDGLVGNWSFNGPDVDWSQNKAFDRSGNGNNVTMTNMATSTVPAIGKVGQAFNFDGIDDHAMRTPNVTSGSNITVSAWVKYAASPTNGVVVSEGTTNDLSTTWYLGSWTSVGTNLSFGVAVGGLWKYADSGIAANIGQWYHIVGTSDGANVRVYVDGILKGTTASGAIDATGQKMEIGRSSYSPNFAHLNGVADEIRTYNRTLSAAEVKQLYLMGK